MKYIAKIQDRDLGGLLVVMNLLTANPSKIHNLRATIDSGQLRLKVNEGPWTSGFGSLDPGCAGAGPAWLKDPKYCDNQEWHTSAPARMVQICPECPRAAIPEEPPLPDWER